MRLLLAVAAAAADAAMLVVGLLREGEVGPPGDLAGALAEVRRQRAVDHLVLGRLSPDEVAQLTVLVSGSRPEDSLVRVVQQRAEGNPLFVREFVRLWETAGHVEGGLPQGVRDVIGRRLDLLPSATRDALRRAAVLGREFTVTTLGALMDVPPGRVLDLLEPAIAADSLRFDGPGLRFGHVLTQEVLYAELPMVERQRLHARAAAVLQAAAAPPASGYAGPMDAIAFHLRRAAPLGGADEALAVTRQAAHRARSQLAYEHAAFQYREALTLLPLITGGAAERATLLLDAAHCALRAGAVEDAWRSCREAADVGRATAAPAIVADAAVVLRGITNSPLTAQVHALSREALGLIGESDPVRAAKLMAQLVITTDSFAAGGDQDLSGRALRIAEATGDPDARFLAMQARAVALVNSQYVLERLSLGDRALRLAEETGNAEYAAWGRTWRLDALWELGRRLQIDAELSAFTTVVGHLRQPWWHWRLTMMQAAIVAHEGRFAAARELADDARELGLRGGHGEAAFFHLVFRAHIAVWDGVGLDEVEAEVTRFVETGPFLARTWLAHLLVGRGRLDEAAHLWAAVAPHVSAFPRNAPEWIVAACGNAEVCVAVGDRVTAAAIAEALTPYADRQAISGAHTPSAGPVSLYLGLMATATERWDIAEGHLRTALVSAKAMDSGPYEAIARLALARLHVRTGRDQAAREHLDHAVRIARRLGMPRVLADATALRDTRHSVLTPREEQVAAFVADGLSNRQIAQRLRLSERTVENHVTHILTKLGFESRARIASWYATRGDASR
ncbi:ATP-binding protein [Luedemannella helvata]|uniref:ATP-binding protein n=1 Tax=Luedemannella helvata TaxID=349315 RepID=UPI0031D940BA